MCLVNTKEKSVNFLAESENTYWKCVAEEITSFICYFINWQSSLWDRSLSDSSWTAILEKMKTKAFLCVKGKSVWNRMMTVWVRKFLSLLRNGVISSSDFIVCPWECTCISHHLIVSRSRYDFYTIFWACMIVWCLLVMLLFAIYVPVAVRAAFNFVWKFIFIRSISK